MKVTQLGMAHLPPATRPRSFPVPRTRRTEIGLNAVIAAAVVVLLTYVLIGPQA